MSTSFRRVAGVPSAAAANDARIAVPAQQAPAPNIREVIDAYIAATRAFIESAAATSTDIGDIANALPDSFGAYRFVLAGAIGGQRARLVAEEAARREAESKSLLNRILR